MQQEEIRRSTRRHFEAFRPISVQQDQSRQRVAMTIHQRATENGRLSQISKTNETDSLGNWQNFARTRLLSFGGEIPSATQASEQ